MNNELKMMLGMCHQVEKIDGQGNFSMCLCVVIDVLVQQVLIDALEGNKLEKTTDDEWKVIEQNSASKIRLPFFEVKYSVIKDD